MKKFTLSRFATLMFLISLIGNTAFAQLAGTYTLPGTVNGNTVNNLTQLAALLNISTVSGTVIFEFTSSYTTTAEVYPISFTAFSGTGNVIIRPAASVSTALVTSGAPGAQALIWLNGVKNLTFDGRPGGTGSTLDWTFQNTGSGSSYPVFKFVEGAQYDALKYITVQASCTNTLGTITFSTSTVTGGNSYDTISHCNVTNYAAYSYIQIYSSGTTANANSNNSIINNNISNFQAFSGSGMPTQGGVIIATAGNGSNWNISGNSIYCAGAPNLYSNPIGGISFGPGSTSTGNIISGNYIGGQQPLCAGGKMKIVSYQANGYPDFDGIYNNSGSVTISNNTIQNIYMGSSYGSSTFCGINISGTGSATVTNNIVGNPTDTNNIVSGINGTMLGIYNHSSGGAVTMDHNIVANLTSNYRAFVSGTSGQTPGAITGIYNYGGTGGNIGATSITNNQVFNLTTASNYNNNLYFYINPGSNGVTFPSSIGNNNYQHVCCGIFMEQDNTNTNTQVISKNTVYGIASTITGGTSTSYLDGIVVNGNTSGTNIINGNLVYGNYAPNTYGTSGTYFTVLSGIMIPPNKAGKYFVQDNIIDLGYRSTDGSSVLNAMIYGIWDNTNINNTNQKTCIYHNSVYIGGSDNSSLYSFAFARNLVYGSSVYDSLVVMNNIFVNNRTSTNASSKAYGLYLNSSIDVQDNYNDIYGTGSHFYYGAADGTSYLAQNTYQAGVTGHEVNALNVDPQYVSPTTATPDLHINNTPTISPIEQAGTATYTITYDFDSLIRANYTPIDLGATVSCSGSPATVTLMASDDTICPGTSVTFTAAATNGGTPVYTFYRNGISVQSSASNIYTTTTLANNDSVRVKILGNSPCASVDTAFSNYIKIVVNLSGAIPSVTLGASQNSICPGTQVVFTATPVNGGSAPIYRFYKNGTIVQNGSGNTYTTSSLVNNDIVKVTLISNIPCASPDSGVSTPITMTVVSAVTPTASISASQNNVCTGTSITFTVSSTNGGTTPSYNFFVNGTSVQSGTGTTYTTSSLSNNDSVWVVVTSNATCTTTSTATSTKVRMIIIPSITPSVTISASQNNICPGTQVTFTAAPTNGGTPTYHFYLNGTIVQSSTSNTYTTSALGNGNTVKVVMLSTATCRSVDSAISTTITMMVNGSVTPTVSITPLTSAICAGTSVTFTTTATGGGSAPSYNFFVNGTSVQNGSTSIYTTTSLQNNDSVWVVLTSNSACASPATATSTHAHITVTPSVTPSVTIGVSQNNICAGTQVTFTATPTNGGTPTYHFYLNGSIVQSSASNTYTTSTLVNGNTVKVVMLSTATCRSTDSATSSTITMVVNSVVTPTVSISPLTSTICAGTSVTFTTTATNAGTTPSYNFFLNGTSVQSSTGTTYTTTTLNNSDSVWVVLTSNATCASPVTATSTHAHITATSAVTPSVTLGTSQNNICPGTQVIFTATPANGGTPIYHFYLNGNIVQSSASNTYTSSTLANGNTIKVVMISNAPCRTIDSATSITITMAVSSSVAPTITITPSATTICTGSSVTFTTSITGGGSAPAYNFFRNGVSVQNGTGSSYTSSALQNNDSVWVVFTSNSACASPATATSIKIHITITTSVTPSVTLSASQNNVCAGTQVIFTATPINGGTPIYHFYLNGSIVQNSSSNTYTSSTLSNGNIIKVVMLSTATCRSVDSATSTALTMVVNSSVTPTVTITPSSNSFCHGTSVTFTTSIANGGTTPTYNFFVNGASVQSGTGSSYITTALNNNDSVWVVLTSNATCASPLTVTSAKAHISLTASVVPAVSLSASQTNICTGAQVIFTATPANGGTPVYHFYLNGSMVQNSASNTYISSALTNGATIKVVMISTATCRSIDSAISSSITMTVGVAVTPVITITPSANNVCTGTNITFTAAGTNGGTSPQYNFFVNGVSVQSGSQTTYSNASLHNNDSVWVTLTSNAACASPINTTSTKVIITIMPSVTPTITLVPSTTSICPGEQIGFTTNITNGGVAANYQFFVNGTSVQNSLTNIWPSTVLSNNDLVKVTLTSNAACASPVSVSDSLRITVHPLASSNIAGSLCSGGAYQFGGQSLTQAGTYRDTLSTVFGCDSIITLTLTGSGPVTTQIADSICHGGSFTFNGSTLTTAGIYHDTLTAIGGCDSVVTLTLSFATDLNPFIYLIGDSLYTTPYTSYQWLKNNIAIGGATGEYITPAHSGQYSVIVTSAFGCSDTSASFNFIASGIHNVTANTIQLYPNPTTGELNIHLSGNTKDVSLKLYDIQGQTIPITNISGSNDTYTIDISNCATGVYYLRIQTDNISEIHKVEVVK